MYSTINTGSTLAGSSPSLCPRLADYIVIVGSNQTGRRNVLSQTPQLLRRYPPSGRDHRDFILPADVVYFCQPEGCIAAGKKHLTLRDADTSSFVFTLTDKDSGKVRYGVCLNFFRPIERRSFRSSRGSRRSAPRGDAGSATDSSSEAPPVGDRRSPNGNTVSQYPGSPPRQPPGEKQRRRTHTLTSLCLLSHHAFISRFREILQLLRQKIELAHKECVAALSKAGVR